MPAPPPSADLPPRPPGPPPRVGRAAAIAGAANLLGRASGLIREIVFAAFFGAGMAADAYNAAFRVPNLLRELLAEGSLSNVYVPLFAETAEKQGIKQAWVMANAVLGVLLVVLGAVTLLFLTLAQDFVYLVASGYADIEGKVALTAWLTRLLAPFLAGLSVASLFGGMLNVRGRFFLPALAPAVLNLFVIGACLLGDQWASATGTPAIGAVAAAATLSGIITAAIQYPALRREGYRFRPRITWHPALRRMLQFMGAALVGIVVVQFNLLVETQLASRVGQGPVSWLMYAFRLVQLPMTIISGSIAVASLAGLSVLLARGDEDGARHTLSRSLELNSLFVFPSAVGLYMLAQPLIRVIYQRGAFTEADTAATAGILQMYAIAVVGICFYRVLLPTFFALKDPYLPMRLSLVVMAAKVPVALGLMYPLGMGVNGLPLSHAITVSFEVVIMLAVLHGRMKGWGPGFWGQQARILLASAGMAAALWRMSDYTQGAGVLLVVLAGAAVYGVLVVVLRVREARTVLRRITRRGPPPPPPGVEAGKPPPPGWTPPQ